MFTLAFRRTIVAFTTFRRDPVLDRDRGNTDRSVAKSSSGTSLRGDIQPRLIKVIYDPSVDDR